MNEDIKLSNARRPVSDLSVWRGADIENDPRWRLALGPDQQAALVAGLKAVQAKGLSHPLMLAEDFPIDPALRPVLDKIQADTRDGLGFLLLQGFPVEGFTLDEIRIMYLGLFLNLGSCFSQDARGAVVADVMERGQVKTPLTRAYGSKHEARLHVDLADAVALLCVRQAPVGATSTLASSTLIYNEILRAHPDWLPMLEEGFHWDRFGEQAAWEPPISPTPIPLFSEASGKVSCRYNRSWITGAFARRDQEIPPDVTAMFDFIDEVAANNRLAFLLQPGDLYVANNYTVLHGKVAHDDQTDDLRLKRHLMRIWYNSPGFRTFSDEERVRHGVISHGNLGWTSSELIARKQLSQEARRLRE